MIPKMNGPRDRRRTERVRFLRVLIPGQVAEMVARDESWAYEASIRGAFSDDLGLAEFLRYRIR